MHFVIVRDNDASDYRDLKDRLVNLCRQAGRPDALVRIACQELEAWYFGDPDALADEFADERLRTVGTQARFRDPGAIAKPARALQELVPAFQKVSGARRMGSRIRRETNGSRSFQALMRGIERLIAGGKS